MKHILLVQPHSDDIVFSAFLKASEPNTIRTVLTIENDPKRIKEDEKFCKEMGMNFDHLNIDYKDETYYGFFKEYKEVDDENCVDWCVRKLGPSVVTEIMDQLDNYIQKFKEENDEYEIIAPMGVGHPAHRLIHIIMKEEAHLFYRDFPHSYKRRGIKQLEKLSDQYDLVIGDPEKEFELHDKKYDLLKRIYKSQSSLLFYEKRFIDRKIDEEYYKLKK
jgi:hypothetical protein